MRNQVKRGIVLTDDQSKALQNIKRELLGDGIATLKGYAGTGKTTLLQEIVSEMEPDVNEIYLMAPTHKAAEVLRRKTHREVSTVHSAFGLRPQWDGDGGYKFVKTNEEPIKFVYRSLVAVDEASMIDDYLYDLLIQAKKQYGLKILFVGDPAQLPPVNNKPSPALDHDGYMLTEIVRQEKDNPILQASMHVRDEMNPQFEHKVNSAGEGILVEDGIADFIESAIESFQSDEYKKTGDFARVLAYRNDTVDRYNDIIRSAIYGDKVPQFVEGEWLVAMEPWTPVSSGKANGFVIQNSEEVIVQDRDIVRIDGWFAWQLKVASDPPSAEKRKIHVLHKREQERFEKKLKSLKRQAKKAKHIWPEFYQLKEKFATVNYSFAMTTHKAQGSTFEHVYMDLEDLLSCRKNEERRSLVYVATTRPSKKLHVLKKY